MTGLSPTTTKESLGGFFVNVRKSGGGPILNLDYNANNHTAKITFQNMEGNLLVYQSFLKPFFVSA